MSNYVSKVQRPDGTIMNIKSYKTESIPMGKVASTSTSTAFTATIDGITALRDGVCVWLTNGVVNSATNFTININGLGAKPVYRSINSATRETTRFYKEYTIFLIYNETRVSGGCWDYVYGFDSNTTYTNMSQTEASAGTVTTGRVISAKVLSDTIEEHTAEINTVLPELVDEGAKNLLDHTAYTRIVNGVTYTVNEDRTITITSNGTNTQSTLYLIQNYTGLQAGTYVLSGVEGTSSSSDTYALWLKVGTAGSVSVPKTGLEFEYDGTSALTISIIVRASQTVNATFKPMICTKADWDISQSYQPYRPNTIDAVFGPGIEIIGTEEEHQNLNNYTEPGVYFCRNSSFAGYIDNKPLGGSGFRLTVENISGTNTFRQTFIKPTDASRMYTRHYSTSTWSSWYVFEGTEIT